MRECKMQEWKMREWIAGVKNAGVENAGVDSRGGKCSRPCLCYVLVCPSISCTDMDVKKQQHKI